MNQAKTNNKSTADLINSQDDYNLQKLEPSKKKLKLEVFSQVPSMIELEGNKNTKKEFSNKGASNLLNEYEKRLSQFIANGFSHSCDLFLRKLSCDSSLSTLAAKYPLLKILKAVLKKFMLNDFEMVYWACFLEASKWDYHELIDHVNDFPDLLTSSEYALQIDYKALLLYLCLSAYLIKQNLNDEDEFGIFEAYLKNIWHHFNEFYPIFADRHSSTLSLKPSSLNAVYKKFANLEKFTENPNHYYDYNSLVDDIIHISPPYNYDRYETSNPSNFLDSHSIPNQPFLHKMEKKAPYNLPQELPILGREPSMNPLNNNDFRLPPQSLLKKESNVFVDLFRGDSYFQENVLNRNESFGLDNLPMQFGGLIRNTSINSEYEGNMKVEENIPYNKHLLNLIQTPENEQKNIDVDFENKAKKGKEGFKLTKSSLSHPNQGGIFSKGNNLQPE